MSSTRRNIKAAPAPLVCTLYIRPTATRSNWFGALTRYLNLSLEIVDGTGVENFAEIFPLHKTPALITDKDVKVTETLAIIYYLISISEKKDFLGGNVNETTQVIRWLAFFNQDFVQVNGDLKFRAKTEEDKAKALTALNALLAYVDNHLAGNKYIASDRITVADIFARNIITGIKGYANYDKYDKINAWLKEISSHPIVQELSK
ncbi:hypothetical protein PMKS-000137 [Pichia membranifaciens]|uniref:GST C-terminal domain-containing protein n=1 Tax=Pichia membranifaciens TaxID=4926 RepID=A0A1Q2YAY1_9ASCO|nr:hypothetical protein PMKS-000137 [Pichia membranifaciens]